MEKSEVEDALKGGWEYDNNGRAVFYATDKNNGDLPVYRLYQKKSSNINVLQGRHLISTDLEETKLLQNLSYDKWRWENNKSPLFYGYKTDIK